MTKGFYNLTSGMLSQTRRLDTVANNMTGLTTPGYKKETYTDTTFSTVLLSRMGNTDKENNTVIGEMSYILAPDELVVDYSEGLIEETGLNLDFAIEGDGFFAIETEDGVEYTRNGNFNLDEEGYLILAGHGRVLDPNGEAIQLPTDSIQVNSLGQIFHSESQDYYYGQLGIYSFADNAALIKGESGLFLPGGQEATVNPDSRIASKSLESSNVDMIREMSTMMTAQRALQSASQILKLYDGVITKTATEVGRL